MSLSPRLRAPHFLIPQESRGIPLFQNLAVVCSRSRIPQNKRPKFRDPFVLSRVPMAPLLLSLLAHGALVAGLASYKFTEAPVMAQERTAPDTTPIYIDLSTLRMLTHVPEVAAPGPIGRAAKLIYHTPKPKVEPPSPAPRPQVTIVLTPMRPDNARQTIMQKNSLPDLRIAEELHLPDVAFVAPSDPAKPRPDLHLNAPTRRNDLPNAADAAAPPVISASVALPVAIVASVDQPRLPVMNLAPVSGHVPGSAGTSSDSSLAANTDSSGTGEVLIASVSPETAAQLMHLPPGSRIALFGTGAGKGEPTAPPSAAPANSSGGSAGNGTIGGNGGDLPAGMGRGNSGGQGGDAQGEGLASISGGASVPAAVGGGWLAPSAVLSSVYPVIVMPRLRRNTLIISTGPVGGGGLSVYDVLHCGKVYTIFLPMPGKNWVLQYCPLGGSAAPVQAQNGVVHMEAGVVPPEAQQCFDFHRFPVSEENADKMIVLHATIGADGAVGDVKVYQGVQPNSDDAAAIAFSRWKFNPALRAKSPIGLEILVGIPAKLPAVGSDNP